MEINQFPVRINPLTGESLWSLLFRLAKKNGITLLKLLNSVKRWDKRYVQRSDWRLIDFSPDNTIDLERLSLLSGCSINDLRQVTFYNLLKTFGINEEAPRSRFLSGMLSEYYRFCPKCLTERVPYYRLLWRMENITGCTKHRSLLLDKCPKCYKRIQFREIENLNVCPHCTHILTNVETVRIMDQELEQQEWVYEAVKTLLITANERIEAPDTACRLLYIISGYANTFDRQQVEGALPFQILLPSLLQHARDSLSQQRTLHLSFVLKTLYHYRIAMVEFMNLAVPQTFIQSLKQSKGRKSEQYECQAPWCKSFCIKGSLVKTGTNFKRTSYGQKLLYYMVCRDCGCEYAIEEDGTLRERTYFIEGYKQLTKSNLQFTGIKEMSRLVGMTEEKVRRCLAYFSTRKIINVSCKQVNINHRQLFSVVQAIRLGKTLKSIQAWSTWGSYEEFLSYRYHPEVMSVLVEIKRPHTSKRGSNSTKQEDVRDAIEVLMQKDQDITIAAVCEIVGVCPETIRGWGCNKYIAEMKNRQKNTRLARMREVFYEKTEEYFTKYSTKNIYSKELYQYLGIQRTVLWRTAPEITKYIMERLKWHNQGASEQNFV